MSRLLALYHWLFKTKKKSLHTPKCTEQCCGARYSTQHILVCGLRVAFIFYSARHSACFKCFIYLLVFFLLPLHGLHKKCHAYCHCPKIACSKFVFFLVRSLHPEWMLSLVNKSEGGEKNGMQLKNLDITFFLKNL